MADTEQTKPEQNPRYRGLKPFQPGQSGNPAGRPKGARSKLGEAFLENLLNDWSEHGVQAIADMRTKNPTDYCKVVASILPKEIAVTVSEYEDLSDAELAEQFAATAARLAGGHASRGGDRTALLGEGGPGTLPN